MLQNRKTLIDFAIFKYIIAGPSSMPAHLRLHPENKHIELHYIVVSQKVHIEVDLL
jgi:hypothetical protein